MLKFFFSKFLLLLWWGNRRNFKTNPSRDVVSSGLCFVLFFFENLQTGGHNNYEITSKWRSKNFCSPTQFYSSVKCLEIQKLKKVTWMLNHLKFMSSTISGEQFPFVVFQIIVQKHQKWHFKRKLKKRDNDEK